MSFKNRLKREEKFRDAKLLAAKAAKQDYPDDPPAKGSEFGIERLDATSATSIPEAVLLARVSSRSGDVLAQRRGARLKIEGFGIKVVAVIGNRKGESGKTLDPDKRPDLIRALKLARRRNCPLIIPAISRALRHPEYHHSHSPHLAPTKAEMKRFMRLVNQYGVRVLCLNDPDDTPKGDEKFLKDMAVEIKGPRAKGGRPRKPGRPSSSDPRVKNKRAIKRVIRKYADLDPGTLAERVWEDTGTRLSRTTLWRWRRAMKK